MRDLASAVPLIRYEHPAPGDLLHLDIKQLGRFSGVVVRPDGRRRGKLYRGWEYLHVAIDDHSRIAFTQILPDFTAASAIAFLRASVAYYATLGIPIRRFPRNRSLTVADFLQCSTRFCGSQVFDLNIDNCVHDFCAYSHPHKHQIGRFDSPIPRQRCRNPRATLKLSLRAVPNSEQKKKCA
jgi:hypothetical protein